LIFSCLCEATSCPCVFILIIRIKIRKARAGGAEGKVKSKGRSLSPYVRYNIGDREARGENGAMARENRKREKAKGK
jgi:hypothetical protein